jgi:GTP-binding protein Era
MTDNQPFKSGFVAVVGRPNAGKSTLVNALVGAKVAIVTPVAQTTRNRILGVVNRPGAQIVLMDTPGIHRPLHRLNEQMMRTVRDSIEERDLVLFIVDASARFGKGDEFAVNLVSQFRPRAVLLLNKIDQVRKPSLLPLMDRYAKLYPFEALIPISALSREGLEEVLKAAIKALPDGPRYFPSDLYTDQSERFLAGELIREKVIQQTREELPYATAVAVEEFQVDSALTRIRASILVEKESQKPILIGAAGGRIKLIGTEARRELEKVFPPKVFLHLQVKVEPGWRNDRAVLARLGYGREGEGTPE